jgi:hypothetical protein
MWSCGPEKTAQKNTLINTLTTPILYVNDNGILYKRKHTLSGLRYIMYSLFLLFQRWDPEA